MTKADQETWISAINGLVAVMKLDRRGELIHEVIQPGQRFTISAEERLLNQDKAADKSLDVFLNGTLTPIRILENTEHAEEIKNNPNVISEEDMRELFKLHWKPFTARVAEVTNVMTLTRLLEMAKEVDATMKQVETIKARKEEVSPANFTEVSSVGSGGTVNTGERSPRAVTPR